MANSFTLIEESTFEALVKSVDDIKSIVSNLNSSSGYNPNRIFTNAEVKEMLGVGDKTLKKLRDSNLLPYHLSGKEYWYLQSDLDYQKEATKEPVFAEHQLFSNFPMGRKKSLQNAGKFILRTEREPNRQGEYPVYIQYTLDGKVARGETGVCVNEKDWDATKQRVRSTVFPYYGFFVNCEYSHYFPTIVVRTFDMSDDSAKVGK